MWRLIANERAPPVPRSSTSRRIRTTACVSTARGTLRAAAGLSSPRLASGDGLVVLVHHGVTLAAGDQPAVRRPRRPECDDEPERDAPPELRVAQARVDRARDDEDETVVHRLHDRDRE